MTLEQVNNSSSHIIIQFLKELYQELGEESESIQFLTPDFVKQMLSANSTEVYLAYDHNKEAVGMITLTESQAFYAGGKYGAIDEMYIKPGYRSNNLGSQIIMELRQIAKRKGWKRLDVTAPAEERWQRTVDFYKKNGFEFTGPKLKLKIHGV